MKTWPEIGEKYKHHSSGHIYTVLALANTANISDKYPPSVIYQGENGHLWVRPLKEFLPCKFKKAKK